MSDKKTEDKMIITWDDIPDDLEEMLNEGEFRYTGPLKFEEAMIAHGFFDYGGFSRSHRVVTKKADEAEFEGIVEALTGKTMEEHRARFAKESKQKAIDNMFETAIEYGYQITKI